jgi:ABC-type multidrug transport system ATPase subunit
MSKTILKKGESPYIPIAKARGFTANLIMPLIFDKVYSRGKLKDISFEVNDGEILAISGPDGGGKDEIFKAITGELTIDSGEIILGGERIRGFKKTGTVFEDYIIYKRRMRKGLYFFSYRRWLKRIDKKKLAIVSEIMDMDREFLLSSSPRHLSKGQRKRFDLARYLITKRNIILLDVPLTGLDLPRRKDVLGNLKKIIARFCQPCLYRAETEKECEGLNGIALIKKGGLVYCGKWRSDLSF